VNYAENQMEEQANKKIIFFLKINLVIVPVFLIWVNFMVADLTPESDYGSECFNIKYLKKFLTSTN